jgi:hypothetical protein
MNLLEYVRALAPFTERRELLRHISELQDEFDSTLSPILPEVREVLLAMETKSQLAIRFSQSMGRAVSYRGNMLELLFKSLENVRANISVVEDQVRKLFSLQFTSAGLTVDRANMLKFVDGLNFYVRYGRKLILFILAQETAARGKAAPSRWTPAERSWVESNMEQFITLFPAMSLNAAELKMKLGQASNAEINPETFDIASRTLGDARMDPLRMQGFSPNQNPFMMLGKYLAEARVARYKAAQEEYYALQHRLLELRERLADSPASPVLQKQIEMYEKRVSDYEFDLAKVEAEALDVA